MACNQLASGAAPLNTSGRSWSSGTIPRSEELVLARTSQWFRKGTGDQKDQFVLISFSLRRSRRVAFQPPWLAVGSSCQEKWQPTLGLAVMKDICRICPQTYGKPLELHMIPKPASESDVRSHRDICKVRSEITCGVVEELSTDIDNVDGWKTGRYQNVSHWFTTSS